MARLYMMRHGQTLFNVMRLKQGWCDSPLTELGQEQARVTGAWFRERGIQIDHYYSSTSERARDTLELAFPGVPYVAEKGVKEWNFGKFEGVTEDLNIRPPFGDFYVPFGGESETGFRARLMGTLTDIMGRPDHKSVLVVSHGAACAQFLRANGYEITAHPGQHMGNCCVVTYDYDGAGRFTPVALDNPNVEGAPHFSLTVEGDE